MIIAVDNIKDINKLKGHEIIYAFDKANLNDLLKTKLHCVRYDKIEKVHINLTNYDIPCKKKAKITDSDLFEFPKVKENKYAIIIPNYNNAKWLEKCIGSVLSQTYKNFKLIIVDDLSTDNSINVIESFKDDRIILIKNRRKRYNGGSRNAGIDYALDNLDFDYFAFLDSDDWWKDNYVLEDINDEITDNEMLIIGAEMLYETGVTYRTLNPYKDFKEFFISDGTATIWCTAWCRIIKKDKIQYFCEDTLMEDRVWSYKMADTVNFNKVKNINRVCYVWNRCNKNNSVTQVRNDIWNASAWCHIGHCLQFMSQMKHKEMIPVIQKRVDVCKNKLQNNIYTQF